MYAAFGDPAARAAATAKAVKRKKRQSESARGKEKEEKIQTPYSIFDEKEMDEKIVCFPFIPFSFRSSILQVTHPRQTKLDTEIAELEIRTAERREALLRPQAKAEAEAEAQLQVRKGTLDVDVGSVGLEADVSMEGQTRYPEATEVQLLYTLPR